MGFVEFIQDYRWWVLAICAPLVLIYGRVLLLAAFGAGAPPAKPITTPIRRLPPKLQSGGVAKPGMTPPPEGRQEVLPGSVDAGVTGHQKAGAAKTVKLPATPGKPTDSPITAKKSTTGNDTAIDSEADALEGLFGKRDDPSALSETPSVAVRRKATRMEELGFHHGIANDLTKSDAKPATPVAPGTATPVALAATPDSPVILPDGTPRSSTAELTSILERIDKFLAEDTPAKPVPTLPPSKTATTTVVKTVTEDDLLKALDAPAPAAKPATTASAEDSAAKGTEAMPKPADAAPAKPDPNKKTQPMWARADAQDDDIDAPKGDEKKPDSGQQRLF